MSLSRCSEKTKYILKSLVPYTEPNLKLVFCPNRFFNDLERLDSEKFKRTTTKQAYYRLVRRGLVEHEQGQLKLSQEARDMLAKYEPQKLAHGAKLLLVFDIPEHERAKRSHLRFLLRELRFKKIQQSVWQTEFDSRAYLRDEIRNNQLEKYVNIYESFQLAI